MLFYLLFYLFIIHKSDYVLCEICNYVILNRKFSLKFVISNYLPMSMFLEIFLLLSIDFVASLVHFKLWEIAQIIFPLKVSFTGSTSPPQVNLNTTGFIFNMLNCIISDDVYNLHTSWSLEVLQGQTLCHIHFCIFSVYPGPNK